MRYLLNSSVLHAAGTYEWKPRLSVREARTWLEAGPYLSYIAYQTTAEAFELMFGFRPTVDQKRVLFQPGDEALVMRLTRSVSSPSVEFIYSHSELGLLRRIK